MRILHILDHSIPLHSGYAFRTRSIIQVQRQMGWETIHITSSKHFDTKKLEEDVDGYHFYRTPASDGIINRLPVLNQYAVVTGLQRRLEDVIRKEQPDILHAHSPSLNGLAAIREGRRFGLPVVYEMRASWEDASVDHGTTQERSLRYRLSRALETYVLKQADAITTICEGLKKDIISRGIADDRISVIPNAVNIEQFGSPSEIDHQLQHDLGLEGNKVIGFIGSFYEYEGLDLLLKAIPSILKEFNNLRVLLVGGGRQEENLKQQAISLGINDRVIFAGRVPHEQVGQYYDLIDVLVYPRHSIRLTELVTPLKPLEAMARQRLFVASDVGGHRELIHDGVTGTLFTADDHHALATAVCKVLGGGFNRQTRLDTARKFVETERSWDASVARYQPVYQCLLDSNISKTLAGMAKQK